MVQSEEILFPYEKIRDEQTELIKDILEAIKSRKSIIAHAPTGLGKTAAALSPVLKYAIDNDLHIFFLTSRHTQHKIAIETLREIKKLHGTKFDVADIIGKKWMCAVPNITTLFQNEFQEYCKNMKETKKCAYFINTRGSDQGNKITVPAKKTIEDLKLGIRSSEEIIDFCEKSELCPYEISIELAKKSKIIIADYFYVFGPHVSDVFLKKIEADLSKSIIIVDEAHNLPDRIRNLATNRLTSLMLKRAIKEAKKYGYSETLGYLVHVQDVLNELSRKLEENQGSGGFSKGGRFSKEIKITKEDFVDAINKEINYDDLVADIEFIAESVRETQKRSYIGGVARFFEHWRGETDSMKKGKKDKENNKVKIEKTDDEEGFARILKLEETKEGPLVTLSYTCLDPSVITGPVIANSHSCIFMSGTLTPTFMYRDLLGADNCIEKEYKSPFPHKNKLNLIVPRTTTKYEKRNIKQYEEIGKICADLANKIKGNVFLFFPSYKMRDSIYLYFMNLCRKTIFLEDPKMKKEEKLELLENFKKYKKAGAVLLGVTSGSFGEGIDMPGDLLQGVIVIGLPLGVPDLETRELIDYFDRKYKKGWEYGYLYPAFQKTLQNAGRCIRSETDRGVIVFLDERYVWPRYKNCFPDDHKMIIAKDYDKIISDFFEEEKKEEEKAE
ncbi:ATP-dependent DNA helicase [Candidatus Woesearchaeota archaeon]|nr:ATP-dependent DNA helicase [Candidatus Woesearchaeota archaeon]MBT5272256.1 ATP-dependent DNA helicase [Candidatus Woesearchaeota archaeon]MBT6041151.1 ATP-dependent DNA helicase [Candidatus Woesearchaeota archaeon]MBT6336528.1 ATP-dependent DNA helicase [Candidatus Woesearchaeota archaeon]MBT7927418.1 ATP-dependent DNA helicase [Candidatus Woesearchaeota archaeon]